MRIAGFQKTSLVDYPGNIAAVVFTIGCNYDCFYCHNRHIIDFDHEPIINDEIFAFLDKRKMLLDGLVISGGEPTLQKGLFKFTKAVKKLGYNIKLDTNGSTPHIVEKLVDNKLVDYIAIDLKAPPSRYREICGDGADYVKVLETVNILRDKSFPFEMRTTFVPQFSSKDLVEMLEQFYPLPIYAIQQYRKPETYLKEYRFMINNAHTPNR